MYIRPALLVKNMGGKEKDALRLLLKERKSILDSMFLETPAELERLSKVNDRLYDLTQKLYSKTYCLYVALLKTGFDPEFDDDIMLEGTLRFRSDLNEDDDSVLAMEEDDQYGSDFRWMLGLINSLDEECETYPCARTWMSYSSKHSPDMTAQELDWPMIWMTASLGIILANSMAFVYATPFSSFTLPVTCFPIPTFSV